LCIYGYSLWCVVGCNGVVATDETAFVKSELHCLVHRTCSVQFNRLWDHM